MALTLNPVATAYKIAKGVIMFNRRRDDGTYVGFNDLNNCPTLTLNTETTNLTHVSSRGGVGEVDLDVPTGITRTGAFGCDSTSAGNVARFLGATVSTISQSSATVTAEAISRISADAGYQLGLSQNVTGVRNISAVTVTVAATARANSTAYTVGQIYAPATPNNHIYICTVAGTSAASPPSFETDGTDFADGTATFLDLGVINGLTSGTDYTIDLALAFLMVRATGKLATVIAAATAAVGEDNYSINLAVDYTRPANTRVQIVTGATAALRGQLRFWADNPYGENQDIFIPDCTLRSDGELAFITEDSIEPMSFTVGINKLDTNTGAIYIDGRPV